MTAASTTAPAHLSLWPDGDANALHWRLQVRAVEQQRLKGRPAVRSRWYRVQPRHKCSQLLHSKNSCGGGRWKHWGGGGKAWVRLSMKHPRRHTGTDTLMGTQAQSHAQAHRCRHIDTTPTIVINIQRFKLFSGVKFLLLRHEEPVVCKRKLHVLWRAESMCGCRFPFLRKRRLHLINNRPVQKVRHVCNHLPRRVPKGPVVQPVHVLQRVCKRVLERARVPAMQRRLRATCGCKRRRIAVPRKN